MPNNIELRKKYGTRILKIYNSRGKIFVIGAGSNVLITDKLFDGAIIKLGRNFSKLSLLNDTTIIAGSSALDKQVSEFAKENSIGGFEFLSCIPVYRWWNKDEHRML